MFGLQLLRRPAHRLAPLLWRSSVPLRLDARHLCEHFAVPIAANELHRNVEVEQTLDGLTR